MSNVLNFNNVKKSYLTVTLADEKETTIMIGTPTKRVMDNLLILEETFNDADSGSDRRKREKSLRRSDRRR